jgi:hypothetical protein
MTLKSTSGFFSLSTNARWNAAPRSLATSPLRLEIFGTSPIKSARPKQQFDSGINEPDNARLDEEDFEERCRRRWRPHGVSIRQCAGRDPGAIGDLSNRGSFRPLTEHFG